jgi:surfeit locus 1 family protein
LRKLLVLVAVLVLAAALFSLGLWQLERAREKEQLAQQYRARAAGPPLHLTGAEVDADALNYRHVTVRGRYQPRYQFLLDNQLHQGRLGYHVITPLQVAGSGRLLLVNRGWVPHDYTAGGATMNLSPPDQELELTGTVMVPRHNPFVREMAVTAGTWPARWAAIDVTRFRELTGAASLPFVMRLDAGGSGGGFVREWPEPRLNSDKNRGYAFQWFAMALAVLATYVVVGYRRRRAGRREG